MNKQTEYLSEKCFHCEHKTLREKNMKDWKRGEKIKKGYYQNAGIYLYCDNCKNSAMMNYPKTTVNVIKNLNVMLIMQVN